MRNYPEITLFMLVNDYALPRKDNAPSPQHSVPVVSLIEEHLNPKRLWQELQEAVGYLSHWAFLRASGLGS
jgi:hypothetical protein